MQVMNVQPIERYGVRLRAAFLPIAVSDDDEDGVFVATDSFSTVYGEGETPEEAVADYTEGLFHQFRYLEQHESMLHSDLRQELSAMRRYLVRDESA